MDIVLEIFDTFLFDRLYASAFPALNTANSKDGVQFAATSTFSSMRELPTAYHSPTQFWTLEPTKYAFMSEWPRDDIWRQTLSLYLITW